VIVVGDNATTHERQ